jgi:hypothetical protein
MGCVSIHINVDNGQLTISSTGGVRRALRYKFIAVRNRKPPSSTKAFVHTVHEFENHNVFISGSFADESRYICPRDWTKQALMT